MISLSTLVFVCILGLVSYIFFRRRPKNIPKGPGGVPFLGNVLQLEKKMYRSFNKWSKEYGDIYSLKFGANTVVMISDPKLIKEVFSKDVFSARPNMLITDLYRDGIRHGLINPDGPHWEQLRRFTLRQLRDFGFGKSSMEDSIMLDVNGVIEWMKSQEGRLVGGIKKRFVLAVFNSLWYIISSQRFKHDDPKLLNLADQSVDAIVEALDKGGAIFFMPWLQHIIPEWSGYNGIRRIINSLREFFCEAVNEHKRTYTDGDSRDFIDAFLKEIKQTNDPDSPFYGEMGEKQLYGAIADLFNAGTDTTSTTLAWTILYLTKFKNVQKKLQQEIADVVGESRACSLTDRASMPYAEAVLAEVLRFSSIVPTGVLHRALWNSEINKYEIPKDCYIGANLHFVHHNPAIWGDPENFRPERFISPDGKTFKKHEALMPFSVGRRQCLGEALARDTLFLSITNIFQRFQIDHDPSVEPNLEPGDGFMLYPKEYKVIITDRMN